MTPESDRTESTVKFPNCSALKDRKFTVKSFPLIELLSFSRQGYVFYFEEKNILCRLSKFNAF